MALSAQANAKKLSVVTGLQRHHQAGYIETMKRVHGGAIGDIVSARAYWNQGFLWKRDRQAAWSDMEWQVRNWLYFTWLSGDHIVEQHVHNIDVVNWAMGGPPVRATGMGGREVRKGAEHGHIYDHFAVEYEYKNGASAMSFCRQIDGCASRVDEVVVGTKGVLHSSSGSARIVLRDGTNWVHEGENPNPYVEEHKHLVAAIESGKPVNEARRIAESTLTAIMGRMSAYTGQQVSWNQAMESKLDLAPSRYEFGPLPPVEVAVPGRTPLV
jgi:predicted dehydrogenase